MIDFFTEFLILVTKNSLTGTTLRVNDIIDEGFIEKGELQRNDRLAIVKLEDAVSWDSAKILSKLLSWLPISDLDKECSDDETVLINKYFPSVLQNDLFLRNRDQAHELEDKSEIEMLEFIATEGIGAHLLKGCCMDASGNPTKYEIDLMFLSQFEVRYKLVPYGAKLILDGNFKYDSIICNCRIQDGDIVCEETPFELSSPNWRFAYNLFMASLLMYETVYNHALECHFKIAGNVLATLFRYKDTAPDCIKDFLVPFLFRTQEVNDRAYEILVNNGGLVHRIFAFTKNGMNRFYEYLCDEFEYKTPLEMDCANTPLKHDLIAYWRVYEEFVSECVDQMSEELKKNMSWVIDFERYIKRNIKGLIVGRLTSTENMKRLLTAVVFNGSVWHEYIGNVSRYLIDSKITSCKIFRSKPNLVHDTEQNYVQAIFLAAITSVQKMPQIMDDLWRTQKKEEVATIWKNLQMKLRNVTLKTDYLYPEMLECSVSL